MGSSAPSSTLQDEASTRTPTESEPTRTSQLPTPRRPGQTWTLLLLAGLASGLVAWLGGEATLDAIKPARHQVNSKGMVLSTTDRRGEAKAAAQNAGLAFLILGGSVGLAWAWPGGCSGTRAERPGPPPSSAWWRGRSGER